MFSRYFIDRPIFASVLSIVITLAGALALYNLPIAQFPQIAPPTVSVDCAYPGASAQVVAETVAAPIEQEVNGVDDMLYMASQCTNDGSYNLTITFKLGVDLNLAQVMVQNRVALALPRLPDVLKQTGVNTKKRSPDILMAVGIYSPDNRYDQLYLSNYATIHLQPELARLPGVSDINMLGQRDYSMRIWVDPDRMSVRGVTAGDVAAAIRDQNLHVATGQVGQQPMGRGQRTQTTLSALGRLSTPEQFEDIVIRATPDGRYLKIKDIGRVTLGAKNSDIDSHVDGKPSGNLAVFLLPDANALSTADIVRAKMEELKKDFPEGLDYVIRYDTTPFIRECIFEVFKTLRDAIILVALVVLLFLQNWRSALIPLVAVPVAIVGTFAVMAAMGFSLNTLTLFGLVLAIGIVVDDAIVVVEAVEHHIEHGMAPRAATIRAMEEVSAPVIAMGLVLSAVFVPCAFITGITGQFFRQFALTIATSTIISTFNSLTLSPALAAILLRPKQKGSYQALPWLVFAVMGGWLAHGAFASGISTLAARVGWHVPENLLPWVSSAIGVLMGVAIGPILNRLLAGFFALFNRAFELAGKVYTGMVRVVLKGAILSLLAYGGLLYLTYVSHDRLPKGFIPSQDMGYLMINVQLPDSASSERTLTTMKKMQDLVLATPGTAHTVLVSGQSMLLSAFGSNFGSMFVILDEFSKRPQPPLERLFAWLGRPPIENWCRKTFHLAKVPDLDSNAIADSLRRQFAAKVPEAMITVLPPPPLRGVGRAGGFKLMIEDRGSSSLLQLQNMTDLFVDEAKKQPTLTGVSSVFRANVPQVYVDLNRSAALMKEVDLHDVFDTLQIYLGSMYVNDLNLFGRTWQVVIQCDAKYRDEIEDIQRLKVKSKKGQMVPLGSLADVKITNGPFVLTRYNMYPASFIIGASAAGVSSRTAIDVMDALGAQVLPPSMATEWTELAFLELQAGDTASVVFGFAVIMVFLVLAAQYESWSLPLAVILVVPLCVLSATAGIWLSGTDVNIFSQIGFVVLVGLASKNAILIVEFAKVHRLMGLSLREATLEACRLRLRPIIMTSIAFILGVLPLILASGAGAEMRRTLGTAVFSGMIGVTLFGIILTPVFFYVVEWLAERGPFASGPLRTLADMIMVVISPKRLYHRLNPRRYNPARTAVKQDTTRDPE